VPIVRIEWLAGRGDAVRREVAAGVAEVFRRVCGTVPADLWIVFDERPAEAWFVGPCRADEREPRP
jgi:phenylpyruvate tautomerase PptA (4-oxalocrotonate tautomerase family)